jgi:hypothetical protein
MYSGNLNFNQYTGVNTKIVLQLTYQLVNVQKVLKFKVKREITTPGFQPGQHETQPASALGSGDRKIPNPK